MVSAVGAHKNVEQEDNTTTQSNNCAVYTTTQPQFSLIFEPFTFIITANTHNAVDFKSHYSRIKRSKMNISNIYLKNESFEIFAFKAESKLVDLEINKGINDEYWWDFMGVLQSFMLVEQINRNWDNRAYQWN